MKNTDSQNEVREEEDEGSMSVTTPHTRARARTYIYLFVFMCAFRVETDGTPGVSGEYRFDP